MPAALPACPGGAPLPAGGAGAAAGLWSVVIANTPFLRGTGTQSPGAVTGRARGTGGLHTPFS